MVCLWNSFSDDDLAPPMVRIEKIQPTYQTSCYLKDKIYVFIQNIKLTLCLGVDDGDVMRSHKGICSNRQLNHLTRVRHENDKNISRII